VAGESDVADGITPNEASAALEVHSDLICKALFLNPSRG